MDDKKVLEKIQKILNLFKKDFKRQPFQNDVK